MIIRQALRTREQNMGTWLKRHYPKITQEQKHLENGTPARGYWHLGYLQALRDIICGVQPSKHQYRMLLAAFNHPQGIATWGIRQNSGGGKRRMACSLVAMGFLDGPPFKISNAGRAFIEQKLKGKTDVKK